MFYSKPVDEPRSGCQKHEQKKNNNDANTPTTTKTIYLHPITEKNIVARFEQKKKKLPYFLDCDLKL